MHNMDGHNLLSRNSLKRYISLTTLLCAMLLCLTTSMSVQAGNSIEAAGEVLTFLLPAAAAGLTVGLKDG